ncbi:helix-turn-helix domain-containing protein [Pseudonocardia nigra]|uniref:helix-turn-helix domain-containing protein n=1 Tax=Pseudonocardia nigra TaxID=1921578 RepID=UPI001FE5848A|nr:helix-turn-helix domain-containing protein [Pseudonocardia nigra]
MSMPSKRADTAVIDTTRLTYTVNEVAHLLNLSRGIAYQYVREGVIPAERVGRRWLIPRKRLHAWLDGRAVA